MHVSDGIISPAEPLGLAILAGSALLAGGGLVLSSRQLAPEEVPRIGLIAAWVFVASSIPVPLGPVSLHLGLYGLAGFFLRRRLFLAIVPALLLQRLLLQQGGWTTLGLNVMTTGSGALAGWLLASWPILPLRLRGFLAGFLGVVTGALATVAVLLAVGYDSRLAWLLYGYLLLGLVEGILTALALEAILRLRPGAFHRPEGAR